jgi:inosine-uridine nucleoside N-ribohydrolase
MSRKVILDCDPGVDDAFALCLALFAPQLEVVGITAVEGNAPADQITQNVQTIVGLLDPPRFPRFGHASPLLPGPPTSSLRFFGRDGLGGMGTKGAALHHEHPSDKLICDIVRSSPGQVTIITLGPLTNVARALRREPQLAAAIDQIVIMGGSVDCIGNVTPAAEFNIHYDPESAQEVFQSRTTKTLIPLDVTRRVPFSFDLVHKLPLASTPLGEFFHKIASASFRAHRQYCGLETIFLHDVVAVMAVMYPELFTTREMWGDVETHGELTLGATIFDRRSFARSLPNMDVAVDIQVDEIQARFMNEIHRAWM